MTCISDLGDIQKETQAIHRLGLSHIVATDLDTLISLVDTIRAEEDVLDGYLAEFEKYVEDDERANYEAILTNYEGIKYEIANLMAYSANSQKDAAYALANGAIAEYAAAMEENIAAIAAVVNEDSEAAKAQLAAVYTTSLTVSAITIVVSIISLVVAVFAVLKLVIMPLSKTQKEITEIIDDIDKREGDLTRRVTILSNQEVAAVGSGINVFMGKLQDIFKIIINNSKRMETVVNEVRDSVMTSNNSVSDVSALTEELSATMQEMSDNAALINSNTESVAGEAGKGFAVVATEISQLAAASQEAANHIQQINSVVTQAVHNLADNANGLVKYMNDSILPEFESFVDAGSEYKNKASYIENVMNEFEEKTETLKHTMVEIQGSINMIAHAIEEGANGVSNAADSIQILVEDMDNISSRMDENFEIATDLKKETAIFTKL
ncbi:MAG: methyl-accepting chemotaxis protein [Clostridiales bacterium]|nr:methyl-accepting chemotaxis protein [Clostridiales bacterium]